MNKQKLIDEIINSNSVLTNGTVTDLQHSIKIQAKWITKLEMQL